MKKHLIAALLVACSFSAPVDAKKKQSVWRAERATDPITGASSCTVTAADRAGGIKFTRTGATYPVVELNSQHGLLVGVSSGGRYRLPTGDIVWRVDDRPFHEIKAADNPVSDSTHPILADVTDRTVGFTMAEANQMVAAMTATSTMASGDKAKTMLAEMLAGQGLIFRSANVQSFGLADPRAREVGQITRKGLTPIPLDESFKGSLAQCGIAAHGGG